MALVCCKWLTIETDEMCIFIIITGCFSFEMLVWLYQSISLAENLVYSDVI